MFAKRFFYVCAGLLCLAVAYHLGARNAGAQAPANPVVSISARDGWTLATTSNGDTYSDQGNRGAYWVYVGNVFGGGPIPTKPETLGRLKARYRTGGER